MNADRSLSGDVVSLSLEVLDASTGVDEYSLDQAELKLNVELEIKESESSEVDILKINELYFNSENKDSV